jgi:hemerythrin
MSFHYWLSEIALGASYMDALHQDFVDSLSRLSTPIDQEFQLGYDTVLIKVERIFRAEEVWMEEIAFPELKHHRLQHASILGTLYQGQSRLRQGDTQFGRNIIEKLLPEWLLFHSSTMDTALAHELRLATHAG